MQIGFHTAQFVAQGNHVRAPVYILPLNIGQHPDHFRRLLLALQKTLHPNAFQNVEQKMGVDLTPQRQKFRLLPGQVNFLFPQTALVHSLYELVGAPGHLVVGPHQHSNLILPLYPVQQGHHAVVRIPDGGGQKLKAFDEGAVQIGNKYSGQKQVQQSQQKQREPVLSHKLTEIHVSVHGVDLQTAAVEVQSLDAAAFLGQFRRGLLKWRPGF